MVVSMLNSMQPTLNVSQHGPVQTLSRMWTLALQDLTQVGLLVTFVIIAWLLASLFSWAFGAVPVVPNRKRLAKLDLCVFQITEKTSDTDTAAVCSRDIEHAHPGMALLEHYGVFGNTPGAWSGKSGAAAEKERAPSAIDEVPLMPRGGKKGSRTPRGLSLLQQYGVFGASPMCWKDGNNDGFGCILTAIT